MSTTVYNGFKIDISDLTYLPKWVEKTKRFVQIEFNKKYCIHQFKKKLYEKVKESLTNINNSYESLFLETELNIFIPEICLYISNDTGIYGSTFKDSFDIHKKLLKRKFITNFEYWNNTDPDENVSESEWELREKVWEDFEEWDLLINFNNYLLTSNYYLSPEHLRALQRYYKCLKPKYLNKVKRRLIYRYLYRIYDDGKCLYSEIEDKVINELNNVLTDEYKGKYVKIKNNIEMAINKVLNESM